LYFSNRFPETTKRLGNRLRSLSYTFGIHGSLLAATGSGKTNFALPS
jgi:hypothetical protein